MTNKSTRRAILASLLALVVSISMLIGSTFAWFTDKASTSVNTIQAGTLDVDLEMMDENGEWVDAEGMTLNWVTTDEVENVIWEPGCTYKLPALRVKNNGNLALKYQIVITGLTGDAELLDVIEFTGIPTGNTYVELQPGEDSGAFVIEGHMDEAAGNDYMGKKIENIAITLYATQLTSETDSYDDQYDAGAEHPDAPKDPALNPDDGSTPVNGDTYVDGFYTYTYNTDEGGWSLGRVSDTKQESYAPILESINGEPVVLLSQTFLFCSNMKEAPAIPNGVQKLDMTFRSCSALTVAPEIPDSVTAIVNGFQYCTSLTTAPEIPDSVTSLNGAFNGCTALTTAPVIPANVTRLYDTFSGCTALTGTITINTNKIDNNTGYFDGTCRQCFKGVDMSNITLTGAATKDILNLIGATGNNWTPIQ